MDTDLKIVLITIAALGIVTVVSMAVLDPEYAGNLAVTAQNIVDGVESWALRYGYMGLFVVSVLGGSVLPAGSPLIVGTFAALGLNKPAIILVASFGFAIGILLNYYLAKILGNSYVERRIQPETYENINRWWNRWGISLIVIFAFVPVFPASALALLCGLFNVNIYYMAGINFIGSVFNSALLVYLGSALDFIFM